VSPKPHSVECREALERLYDYLDRELTPEWEEAVGRHLRECSACFCCFEFERAYLRFLEARIKAQGAPPEVKRRILRQLFEAEEP
jgi:anti-sigma factor (TIGR02949 family)